MASSFIQKSWWRVWVRWNPDYFAWGWHAFERCCWLYVALGPLEVGIYR